MHPMQISDILSEKRVALDVVAGSKKAILEELARLLASSTTCLSEDRIFESLLARERLGTTGVGGGIAIPHGRVHSPVSTGAFVRTQSAIQFDAIDNAPVDLFFALCVPADATSEHLDLLASLARKFSDTQLVDQLRLKNNAGEVFEMLTVEEK